MYETHSNHYSVYRVTWLRSIALRDRWMEESKLAKAEMGWVVNYFTRNAERWAASKAELAGGYRCYASKQESFWKLLANHATDSFGHLSIQYRY